MAIFYSTEVTAKNASSGEKYDARTNAGSLKVAEFNYTTVGTEAADDVIEMAELPAGARIIGFTMQWEDLGTSTGDLGITSGGQELAAGLALGTADDNYVNFQAPLAASAATVYLEILTATADADKDISGTILYIVDAV